MYYERIWANTRRGIQMQMAVSLLDGFFSNNLLLFSCLVVFRLVNACAIRTFFSPDEYWQGPEVAHRVVFGYGYLTWEWTSQLRGYLFPLIYAAPMAALKVFGLATPDNVVLAPRLTQGVIAAVGDFYMYHLARRLFGPRVGQFALGCQLVSWFNLYCLTRTFSNSIEAVLTVAALYYFPYQYGGARPKLVGLRAGTNPLPVALALAALGTALRPTHAALWVWPGLRLLLGGTRGLGEKLAVATTAVVCGVVVLGAAVYIDKIMYHTWVVVVWNFFKFNVLEGKSSAYGTHPFHWYFTSGFPLLLTTFSPLVLYGAARAQNPEQRSLGWFVAAGLLVYSFVPHKEERFVFPLLAPALVLAGHALAVLSQATGKHEKDKTETPAARPGQWVKVVVVVLVVSQVAVAAYTTQYHQRGAVEVVDYLRQRFVDMPSQLHKVSAVHFYTNCHATPYHSHIHQAAVKMKFLDCSPDPVTGSRDDTDTERFRKGPNEFLNEFLSRDDVSMPRFIVMWEDDTTKLKGFLRTYKYMETARFFNEFSFEGGLLNPVAKHIVLFELESIYGR